jgi:hypothetical protein
MKKRRTKKAMKKWLAGRKVTSKEKQAVIKEMGCLGNWFSGKVEKIKSINKAVSAGSIIMMAMNEMKITPSDKSLIFKKTIGEIREI